MRFSFNTYIDFNFRLVLRAQVESKKIIQNEPAVISEREDVGIGLSTCRTVMHITADVDHSSIATGNNQK